MIFEPHEVTGRRLGALRMGRCGECGGETWHPGPRGGASQNFECTDCRRRYNITIHGNHVLFAQDIGPASTGADWSMYYEMHKPRRLLEAA